MAPTVEVAKRGRGRPPGSKNKVTTGAISKPRDRGRLRTLRPPAPVAPTAVSPVPSKPKVGRRPAGRAKAAVEATTASKPRGRPPKTAVTPSRPRGRPPKSADASTPKPRGRPPKSRSTNTTPAKTTSQKSPGTVPEPRSAVATTPASTKRRGRPPKAASGPSATPSRAASRQSKTPESSKPSSRKESITTGQEIDEHPVGSLETTNEEPSSAPVVDEMATDSE